MVKGKNSGALKEYHACARRNFCGKKYAKPAARKKKSAKQPVKKPAKKKRPAKKQSAKNNNNNNVKPVEPLKSIPRQKPRKVPLVQTFDSAPMQRGQKMRILSKDYLQRGAEDPNAEIADPPIVFPPNYEKGFTQFFKQVNKDIKRKIKNTGLGRGGKKRGQQKRKNLQGRSDLLRALDEHQHYQELKKFRKDVSKTSITRGAQLKLKQNYLKRVDKLLGENVPSYLRQI